MIRSQAVSNDGATADAGGSIMRDVGGGRRRKPFAGRALALLAVIGFVLPLLGCEREQGNPLPQTPPKPRIENH